MNILFLLKSFEMGGLEIVTSMLANKFVTEGHHVSILAFRDKEPSIKNRLDCRVKIHILRNWKYCKENVCNMHTVILQDNVQIIINQWGLPCVPIRVARKASKGLNIKLVSVYHNTPDMNGRLQNVDVQLSHCKSYINQILLRIKRILFKIITSEGMRYNYYHSDYYMVLSPSFINKFKTFTRIKNPSKLLVQTNPVTIDSTGFKLDFSQKQKEIIYVGRIDYNQKRVSRVIDTWNLLEKDFPDWQLTIVGDGIERQNIEEQVKELNLINVSFEGFQQPEPYYKRASILILTSEYEGFPLVLAECMSFGVVPVVYASYSSVYDIITDGEDGMILPYRTDGFSANEMTKKLSSIMKNADLYQKMAINAKEKSRKYSISSIYASWNNLFKKLED